MVRTALLLVKEVIRLSVLYLERCSTDCKNNFKTKIKQYKEKNIQHTNCMELPGRIEIELLDDFVISHSFYVD